MSQYLNQIIIKKYENNNDKMNNKINYNKYIFLFIYLKRIMKQII